MTKTELTFHIISAVGSLATFGAFIYLFKKDESKQEQIDKLSDIAAVLDSQNESLKAQNDLMAQQVEILRNQALGGDNNAAIQALHEIEAKKLKLSVLPILSTNGAGYNGSHGELNIKLSNKGEPAKLLDFILSEPSDIVLHSKSVPYDLEKGARRNIYGRTKGDKHIKDCEYKITILYQDKLLNKYRVLITGKGASVKIGDPTEEEQNE